LAEWRATYLLASDRARATKLLYDGLTKRYVDPQIGSIPLDRLRPADATPTVLRLILGTGYGEGRRSLCVWQTSTSTAVRHV
jgi:hypothetical protein